ncbi:hypothetical protein C8N24_0280 [Solirubrobacter pauli]|uniref:Uncharacterized protein n=1 Tax=Solirubrobacter pauli TaxID=166793 RepID=A0A660L7Y2_9ACTN|nr:hypothetical protein C8N24_0280 [Solirubrobacter pauli]
MPPVPPSEPSAPEATQPPAAPAPAAPKAPAKPSARKPVARTAGADTGARLTVPPVGARQQDRFQCRLTSVVSENVTQTEQLLAHRTKLSLNAIREIAVWSALGDPDNVDRFIAEVLPKWLNGRNEATVRAATGT